MPLLLQSGSRLRLQAGGALLLQTEADVAHVRAPAPRSVNAGYGAAALSWQRPLDPHEIIYYTVNWAEELGATGDSIATNGSLWTLSGAAAAAGIVMTAGAHTYDTTSTTVWLSVDLAFQNSTDWNAGEIHSITNRITTVTGQVFERTVNFTVKNL